METSYLLVVLMALSGLSVADAECCPPSFPQPPPRPPGVTERYICDSGPDIDMSRWSKAENTGVTVGVAVTLCVLILMLTGAAVGYKLYKRRYSSTKIGPRGLKVEDNFLFNFRLRGIKFKPRSDKEEDPDKLSKEQVTPESPDEHKDRLSIGSSSSGIGSIHSDVHEDDAHQMEPQSLPADMVIGMHHLPPIHQNITDPPRKQDQATTHHPAVLLDPKLLGDTTGKNAVFDSISRPPSEQMKLGLKGQSNFFRREPDETVQKKYIQHKDRDDNITYDTVVVKKEAYGESDA